MKFLQFNNKISHLIIIQIILKRKKTNNCNKIQKE